MNLQQVKAPGRMQQRREISRRKILDAGIKLFSKKGFDGTAISEIATEAKVKKALVMHHFVSKDQLWRDCVDDIYERVDGFFSAELGPDLPTSLEQLRLRVHTYVKAALRFPGYVRIPLVEGMADNERVRWLSETHIQRHLKNSERQYKAIAVHCNIPYDAMKLSLLRTGWVQLLVANKPLYEHASGKSFVNEKKMLAWADEVFDLLFSDTSS